MPEIQVLLLTLAKGAVSGLIAVAIGYAKNTPIEKFDWRALVSKLPIGVVVGGIAAWRGIEFSSAMEWASAVGVIILVDQIVKLVMNRVWPTGAERLINVKHVARRASDDEEADEPESTPDAVPESVPAEQTPDTDE